MDKNEVFDDTYLKKNGISHDGLIYFLDRIIKEDKINIEYEIVKINFNNPEDQKSIIINNIKNGDYSCWSKRGL